MSVSIHLQKYIYIYQEYIYIYKQYTVYTWKYYSLSMPSPEIFHDFWWSTSQPGWSLELPHHRRSSCRSWFPLFQTKRAAVQNQPLKNLHECTVYRYIVYIQYIYSIHPPQRKGYIKRNLSHFRICPQKSRGYHLSLITIYLQNIYQSSICISPTQPGATTRQVTLPRPRTFLWRLHRPASGHTCSTSNVIFHYAHMS